MNTLKSWWSGNSEDKKDKKDIESKIDTSPIVEGDDKIYKNYQHVNHPIIRKKLKSDHVESKEEKESGSLLMEFLKTLRPGMNLVSITCPSVFLSPYSLLETRIDYAVPIPDLLFNLSQFQDPLNTDVRRMIQLTKWILINLSFTPTEGVAKMKPFNPILGEQFHCVYDHRNSSFFKKGEIEKEKESDKDNEKYFTYSMAEQVKHHPPITSQFMENKHAGFKYEMTSLPKPDYSLIYNYFKVNFVGDSIFTIFDKSQEKPVEKEHYNVSVPPIYVYGIIWGKPVIYHEGLNIISCKETNLRSIVRCYANDSGSHKIKGFIQKINSNTEELLKKCDLLNGNGTDFDMDSLIPDEKINVEQVKKHKILVSIKGHLNGKVVFKPLLKSIQKIVKYSDEENKSPFGGLIYNTHKITDFFPKKIVKPVHKQSNLESRNVWHKVTKNVLSDDLDKASAEKHFLEETQRARRKAFKKPFEPYYFKKIEGNEKDEECLNYVYQPKKNNYSFNGYL